MDAQANSAVASLYESDETGWLEWTADLVAQGRCDELDRENLSEFLRDMARRDKREVRSRLRILLTHLLKWEYQQDKQTGSWRATILTQRRDLKMILESSTLRNHASEILAETYRDALEMAAVETMIAEEVFPCESPWSLDQLMDEDEPS